MIKITYDSLTEGISKPEQTLVRIYPNKMFVSYNIPGKSDSIVKQMRKDGRTNVIYSRGIMIQLFMGKTEKELLEIAKQDIENGVYASKDKFKKDIKITNLKITEL